MGRKRLEYNIYGGENGIDTSQRVADNNCDHEEENEETESEEEMKVTVNEEIVSENYLQPPNVQETIINQINISENYSLFSSYFNLGPISSLTSHIYN